ncbi:Periplasmic pH-dependent serine endoprotease DegQ [Arthrobacter sp. SO5]|uniref:trypsin-like peptidase domain-containing protein n=1 Tax=Arthrobacter sp. SO5 TaxID=1897055 RepID=UPI001E352D81|nr:trypsin-like peptidase domain-containing protein [Arthrobacter sp. SO5]MCB5275374.1 Periplasmic pH-dependent serine endoprotease DegQ [Arthrobacter sp. SO5]
MTENPAQGASPEPSPLNEEQAKPLEAPSGHQQASPAHDSAAGNPTLRLDRAADDGPRPVYPQHQPSYGHIPEDRQAQTHPTEQFDGAQERTREGQAHDPAGYGHGPYPSAFGQPQHTQGQSGQPPYGPYYANQPPAGSPYASDPAHAPKRKAAFGVPTLVASILAAGLIGGGVVAGTTQLLGGRALAPTGYSSSTQAGPVIVNNKDDVNAITAAAVKASPSVVTIKATSGSDGGTGSGIVLDGEGHVLTNTHVVTLDGKAAKAAIEVRTSDGRVFSATIVGTDPLSDLAVVKIDKPSGLIPATLGDSGKLNVGDTAVAIGSPLGLTGTVTDGIVSTLNRTISVASSAAPKEGADNSQGGGQGFQFAPPGGGQGQSTADQGSISINVIQTDAAINPGNSGGALVNTKGEIIGVNVAIASAGGDATSSGNIGVGFSIPINNAKRVAQEIISAGKASHGQFGVSVKPKTASSSASGFSVGAEVATVESGSAADKAGVKVGDVVMKFQQLTISDPNQLTAAVREQPAGATVKVTVLRNGQQQELDVTLGAAAEQ